jgi:16S rRNA U516 pseudouridylate synthase RsuA-like enzyme
MTAAVGFPTLRLVRYSIGAFNIEGWDSGQIEELDEQKIFSLFQKKKLSS